ERMRHSNPRLTMNRYTRAKLHDLGTAVQGLPKLAPPPDRNPEPAVLKAAGTDGGPADRLPSLALPLALVGGNGRGRSGTSEETAAQDIDGSGNEKPPDSRGFEDGRGLVRTVGAERAGFEPPSKPPRKPRFQPTAAQNPAH